MASQLRFAVALLASLILVPGISEPIAAGAEAGSANFQPLHSKEAPKCIAFEFFYREGSATCQRAKDFLAGFARRHPEVQIVSRNVGKFQEELERLKLLSQHFRLGTTEVPSFYFCRKLMVGFEDEATTGRQLENLLTIHIYVREGCPRCARGKRFIPELMQKYPGFNVRLHDVANDPQALTDFEQLMRRQGITAAGVPTFDIFGQIIVGFWDEQLTGQRLEKILQGAFAPCPPAALKPTPAPLGTTSSTMLRNGVFAKPNTGTSAMLTMRSFLATLVLSEPLADKGVPMSDKAVPSATPPVTESEKLDSVPETVTLPMAGEVRVREIGLPAFTILIGLIDGFNPCAMWVLLLVLSLLVNIHDRTKILAIAGTFVLVSGLAYFAFMTAWLNVFLLVGYTRTAQIALGSLALLIGVVHVKDFFAFHSGFTLSIPEGTKPGIYARVRNIVQAEYLLAAIAGAVLLAVLVNTVELLCTAGLPALYTQILTMHHLPAWENYLYLGLYNVAYMLDDTLMLGIVVVTLSRTKLQERGGRWLKLISGLVILALGLLMLFKPEWLDWGGG